MVASFNYTPDKRIPLSEAEYNLLADILGKGDRAGFYMAYYAMTGNVEALLTAKVSTFSETIGGVAFAANWLMQDEYRTQGAEGNQPYQGIYYLSHKVAESILAAVHADMLDTDEPGKKDNVGDGLINQNRVLIAATDAWMTDNNVRMFPGNFPIAYGLYTIPGWSAAQAADSPGFDSSVRALLYASYFGKQQGDMTGSTIIDGPNGSKLSISTDGRVNAVFDNTVQDFLAWLATKTQSVLAFFNLASPEERLDPFLWLSNTFDEVLGTAFGSMWTRTKQVWAAELPSVEANIRRMTGVGPNDPLPDLSAFRKSLSEFSGGNGGDINPNQHNTFDTPTTMWKVAPTDQGDVLYAKGTLNSLKGNDLVFGGEGADNINGGDDNDILWGREGSDRLNGGDGDDFIRGGFNNDTLIGGKGNDVLSGGDLASKPNGAPTAQSNIPVDGLDTVDYRTAAGPVTISVTNQDPVDLQNRAFKVQQDGDGGQDTLHSIEKVFLSSRFDTFIPTLAFAQVVKGWRDAAESSGTPRAEAGLWIDGGSNVSDPIVVAGPPQPLPPPDPDVLNFSNYGGPVYIGPSADKSAVEVYANWEAMTQQVQTVLNLNVATGPVTGRGFIDPYGLRFSDFETIIGTSGDDRMALWWMNPHGELTAEQEQALLNATRLPIRVSNDPQTAQTDSDARMYAAGQIDQNQIEVLIKGGDGKDMIQGTRTGINRIEGGENSDHLFAGGYKSTIYGGAGIDKVTGGGFGSILYGGSGGAPDDTPDIFDLSNNAVVKDANTLDHIMWGPYHLTGGVQQWWMEGEWAYVAPFSSLLSGAPLGFLNVFGALAVILDQGGMTSARYTVTQANQLVVQVAGGRGGQAIVENYSLDTESVQATGNIVVFKQVLGDSSLAAFTQYIKLAMAAGFGGRPEGTDPLVLDLDGDGLELTRPDAANVYFDIDQDGFAERTAWVSGDDGLLARDLNGNGNIDDIGELFGNATTPGFTVLATLDSNSDGTISAADSAFGTLRIWRDLDGDGVVDAGELVTLADAGITAISLATSTPAVGSIRGNTVRAEATFTRADGTSSKIADVLLENVQVDSRYLGDTTVSSAAAALPNLKGFGNVTDLAVAMTNDAALLGEVTSFKDLPATTNWAVLKNAAESILFKWTGVDTAPATAMANGAFDTQKLAFLEKYFGQQLTPRDTNGIPSEANVAELIASWEGALEKAAIRLAAQGPLHVIFDDVPFELSQDKFIAPDAATLAGVYAAAIAQLSSNAATALTQWNTDLGPELKAFADALLRSNGHAIRADFAIQSLVRALDTTTSPLDLSQLLSGLGVSGAQVGTAGNDALFRTAASGLQVYVGGAGNDTITGGNGQDVYVFGRGFGQDTIYDSESTPSGDRIRLALLNPDDVTIKRVGNDLVIEVNGTSDRITVQHQYDAPQVMLSGLPMSADHAIEEIQFADGTVYEPTDIASAIGLGTAGNDVIDGTAFADVIEGLTGDDLLRGGDSADTYYYTFGDGRDTIQEVMGNPLLRGSDTLFLFGGITPSDMRLVRVGASSDLTIAFDWAGDSITIKDQLAYGPLGYQTQFAPDSRIEAFMFGSGGGFSWLDIQSFVIATYTTDGADVTYGFGTSDEFYASSGDDLLVGFDNGDAYHFGRGAGHDTIHDQQLYPATPITGLVGYTWGEDDAVLFSSDILPSDVTFSRTGASPDLLITINDTGETLLVQGQFDGVKLDLFDLLGMGWFDRIEEFRFADGTVLDWEDVLAIVTTGTEGNDTLYGAFYADTMDGRAGDDFLSGGDDGDTYVFGIGYGHDTIQDKQTNVLIAAADTLRFGPDIGVTDVVFTRDGATDDLLVSVAGGADTLRIVGQYDVAETGPFGAQAFDQIELFRWDDGTVKSFSAIHAGLVAAAKTSGDDLIVGWHFEDTIDGGAGNDRLEGQDGSDSYVFNLGYGQDVVNDFWTSIFSGNDDKVLFGPGIAAQDIVITRVGQSGVTLSITGTTDTLTVEGQFDYGVFNIRNNEIESFVFNGGTTWSAADLRANYLVQAKTAGNDTIEGFWSDDILDGGAGNDTLRGGDGSDTYRFGLGGGADTIEETVHLINYANDDTVQFGAGITAANTILTRSGNDLIITFSGAPDQLTITGQFAGQIGYGGWWDIERFTFTDGTVWTDTQVREKVLLQAKTSGDDTITGFYTADTLDGGAGNDILRGAGGGDTYAFGKGFGLDRIEESFGFVWEDQPDTVLFNANTTRAEVTFQLVGNDLRITIAGVSDTLTIAGQATGGMSLVEFFQFADGTILSAADVASGAVTAQATAGNDTITGTNGADVIDGGAGNDALSGRLGADTYVFGRGSGQDTIDENGDWSSLSADSLIDKVTFKAGVAPTDLVMTRVNNDLVIAISGTSDQLTIKDQFAATTSFWNADRIDQFAFADGTVWSSAEVDVRVMQAQVGGGNDTQRGYDSADTLDGLAGNDTLTGYRGADTYLFGRGSGQDIVDDDGDFSSISADSVIDTVSFKSDVRPTDLALARVGNDLVITIAGAADQLTIKNQFAATTSFWNADRIDRFVFADGTTWTGAEVDARLLRQIETAGNDTIVAYDSADTLDGKAGNDMLSGLQGEDTYLFGRGSGADTIDENGNANQVSADSIFDYVRLGDDVAPEDIALARTGNDLVLTITGTTDQLTIKNQFYSTSSFVNPDRVERFVFDNGTTWTAADIDLRLLQAQSTAGNDTITGYDANEVIDGLGGNDTLTGLVGEDTYVFGRGSGADTIDENGNANQISADSIFDHIQFKSNIALTDLTFTRSGNDLIIAVFGTSDQIRIVNQLSSTSSFVNPDRVERFDFADGTTLTAADMDLRLLRAEASAGNDTLLALDGNETLDGFGGNDALSGFGGADTYVFGRGYGVDTIDENGGSPNTPVVDRVTLKAGLAPGDLQLSRVGSDLVIAIAGTSDQLVIKGQLISLYSTENQDLIEQLVFADGTVWSVFDIVNRVYGGDGSNQSTAGNDAIVGTGGADTLDGLGGTDALVGAGGSDTYRVYQGGGNDRIDDEGLAGDFDQVQLVGLNPADVTLGRLVNDLLITINATGEIVTVFNHFLSNASGIEQLTFAGTTWNRAAIQDNSWLLGTPGSDTLVGSGASETLDGRGGADLLKGGWGSDTYLYRSGDGNDTIQEDGLSNDVDKLKLIGLNASDVTLGRTGWDLYVTINATGESIRVVNHFDWSGLGLEQLIFQDGTIWDRNAIQAQAWYRGTEGADTVNGTGGAESFDGRGGDDTLNGGDGNDIIIGGAGTDILNGGNDSDTYRYAAGDGNDLIQETNGSRGEDTIKLIGLNPVDVELTRSGNDLLIRVLSSNEVVTVKDHFVGTWEGIEKLEFANGTIKDRTAIQTEAWFRGTSGADTINGSSGADTIDGRGGNDTLNGNNGGDTYIYGIGSGSDLIQETNGSNGEDIVKLIGLNPADVELSRNGNNLLVRILSSNEVVTVKDHFVGTWEGIEKLEFANGTIKDRTAIQAEAWFRGTSGADTINGTAAAEVFDGRGGDDTLNGDNGADTYIFGVGSGNDLIQETNGQGGEDIVKLVGLNLADVELTRAGNNMLVRILSSNEVVTIKDHFVGTWEGMEKLEFADGILDRTAMQAQAWFRGTSGADIINGSTGADTIDGRGGDDTLNGNNGADTYIFGVGSGNDLIQETNGQTGTDIVKLIGINPVDVALTRTGNNLQIRTLGSNETVTVKDHFVGTWEGIEQLLFANGTTWDRATIEANVVIRGTTGNDNISGGNGNDTFLGDLGDDSFFSAAGNDTFIYRSGDGSDFINEETGSTAETDVLRFTDLNAADITLSRAGVDLFVRINSTDHQIEVDEQFYSSDYWGIERIEFADGSSWDRGQIAANAWIRGTTGADNLSGSGGNDFFFGDLGNDSYYSTGGSDTFIYRSGDGNEYIDEESGSTSETDTLRLTDLNAADVTVSRDGVHLVVRVNATNQTVTLDEQFWSSAWYGIDRVEFADGSSWDRATLNYNATHHAPTGAVTISGTAAEDQTLTANAASIQDADGLGSFTYQWQRSDGAGGWTDVGANQTTYTLGDTDAGRQMRVRVSYTDGGGTAEALTSAATGTVANVNDAPTAVNDSKAVNESALATGSVLTNDSDADIGDTIRVSTISNVTSGSQAVPSGGNVNIAGVYGTLNLNSDGSYSYSPNNAAALDLAPGQNVTDVFTYAASDPQSATGNATLTFNITGVANAFTGTAGDDMLTGTASVDSLDGLGGNDVLIGGAGADALIGGSGTDTASYSTAPAAVIANLATPGSNTGHAAGDTYNGIENLTGSGFNDTLTGDTNANTLDGGAGNDTLGGGDGNDTLIGGVGGDAMTGGNGTDTASYATAAAGVTANLATPAGNTGDAASDSYTTIENLTGSGFNDTLTGNTSANALDGGAGDDTLIGAAGADALIGGLGTDTASYAPSTAAVTVNLATPASNTGDAAGDTFSGVENVTGGTVADNLTGDTNANVLNGAAGNDTLNGGDGNDVLMGGAGGDVMTGGNGTDTASYETAAAAVTANLGTPASNTGDAASDTYTTIENLTGSAFNDTLTGNASANVLDGGNGDDTLTGGAGADVLIGGAGIDTASYSAATAAVVANLTTPASNTGDAAGDTYNGIENLTGGTVADTLTGDGNNNTLSGLAGNDTLVGNDGDDRLIGGAGADVLNGGNGLDTASYATSTATVVANLTTPASNTGDAAGDTYTAIENLTGGSGADTLTGNTGANVLDGGNANDILVGGAGADTLIGGAGTDTASYTTATLAVIASLANAAGNTGDAAGDTYSAIENLTGGAGDDTLTGDGSANALDGGNANDTLIGGAGADVLTGGAGTDTASYATAAAAVVANLASAGSNSGDAAGDTYATIENLTGSAFNDTLTGTTAANVLDGGGGDDTLTGGAGADTLIGGSGIDTASYSAATAAVVANLLTPASNTGEAAGDTYNGIENLTGGTVADTLTGNDSDNVLSGLAGNDNLSGGNGNDTLIGGAGADVLNGGGGTDTASYATSTAAVTVNLATPASNTGDASGDTFTAIENVTGGTAADNITGDANANTINGGGGNDTLNGGNGDDILIGSAGSDAMTGGSGIDTASYANATAGVTANMTTPSQNTGDAAGDTYNTIENLLGSAFADTLRGDANANRIEGGAGNDTLTGNAGNDTFVFHAGFGLDTISDFAAGASVGDVIQVDLTMFANFADIQSHASQVGSHTVITLDAGNTITLTGVTVGTLNANDFLFV